MSLSSGSAIFFDRDGVLNVDHGYVFRPDQFEWMPGARQSIRKLNQLGVLVLVVTNQSGIARGLYTMSDVDALMETMQHDLGELEARIDKWYVCPHHPTEGKGPMTIDCNCRKPKPGMILQAIEEFQLDPIRCALIGDKDRDIEAAQAAGIPGLLFHGNDLLSVVDEALGVIGVPNPGN